MTNYNEKITKAENLEALKTIVTELNNDILDNVEHTFTESKLVKAVKDINESYKDMFSLDFVKALETDRKTAFESLLKCPNYTKITLVENDNGTYGFESRKALFSFADLENFYQFYKSNETDKYGKKIRNKDVTIFSVFRFYGVCDCFIRNLFINNLTIDNSKIYDLSRIKLDDNTIFTEADGKCFSSTSNNSMEKQLNVLVKFFHIDVKMLKKDLIPLRVAVQKLKRDKDSNKTSITEIKTLKFADTLFSIITSRYYNENVKVFTNDGNEVELAKATNKTTNKTEATEA